MPEPAPFQVSVRGFVEFVDESTLPIRVGTTSEASCGTLRR